MEPIFCTLFDSNYGPKGVAMIRSLERHCSRKDFEMHVLALDDNIANRLMRLWIPNITVYSLNGLEQSDTGLLGVKASRTWQEYCWTLGSRFSRYIMESVRPPSLTYVDADMYFFDDPMRPLNVAQGHSIAITPHHFAPDVEKRLIVNGKFCVSWVSWLDDDIGRSCLSDWSNNVLQWCAYRHEDGKFADQKYLDSWPDQYGGALIELSYPVVWAAPWNMYAHSISAGPNLDREPVVATHFHEHKETSPGMFYRTGYPVTKEMVDYIYKPYEVAYLDAKKELGL